MMDIKTIVLVLPIIFMIHDFEEIIFFKSWLLKNESELYRRFPWIARKILPHFKKISTTAFTIGVAEEFILISAISVIAATTAYYQLWYGIFIGFSLHILIHILQWIIYGKYIPSIVTSFLVLPYCVYAFVKINEWQILGSGDKIAWGITGFVLVILNLLLVHKLIAMFGKQEN